MTSAELRMYLDEATAFYQTMLNMVAASKSFGVHVYEVPPGKVALEMQFPDIVYGRELGRLPNKLGHADNFLNVIEELVTGSRTPHKILWASTTDLIFSIPLDAAVVAGALLAYERLLLIAEKHLNIVKLIRDLRKHSGKENLDVEEQIQATVKASLEEAVRDIVLRLGEKINNGRQNELQAELKSVSTLLISDLSMGMRFNCDARYEYKLINKDIEGSDAEEVGKRLDARQSLEMRINGHVDALGDEEVKLLTGNAEVDIKPPSSS